MSIDGDPDGCYWRRRFSTIAVQTVWRGFKKNVEDNIKKAIK